MLKRLPVIALLFVLVHSGIEKISRLRQALFHIVSLCPPLPPGGEKRRAREKKSGRFKLASLPEINAPANSQNISQKVVWQMHKHGSKLFIKWQLRRSTHKISLTQYQLSMFAVMAGAFVAGSFFTISEVLLPRIRALSETTLTLPTDTPFNQPLSQGLAGYDDGGGSTYVLSEEITLATNSAWLTSDYQLKKQVTLKNLNTTQSLATQSATTTQIVVNTKELYDAGKLQENCEDLRVIFVATQSANQRQELPRSISTPENTTCALSTATTIAFPLQEPLWKNGGVDSNYELYYSNAAATNPTYGDDGYNIVRADGSSASATLVCPFNGSTTCVDGETPTTQTGAIRYSGGKGAMQFDGTTSDYASISNISELTTGSGTFTLEGWFKLSGAQNTNSWNLLVGKPGYSIGLDFRGGSVTANMVNSSNQFFNVSTSMTTDQWHHVAMQFDSTSKIVDLYLDGVHKGQNALVGDMRSMGSTLYVGTPFTGYNLVSFNGLADEVRLSTIIRYTANFTPQMYRSPTFRKICLYKINWRQVV